MRKGMTHTITLIATLVIGLLVVLVLVIMVGDKMGITIDTSNKTIDIAEQSRICQLDCLKCCNSGYGDYECSRQYSACACTCE